MTVTPTVGLFRFGVFEFEAKSGKLSSNGIRVRLAQQSTQVLRVLLERPGEIVTREELHKLLWPGGVFVDFDHGLNKSVQKIREALSDSYESPRYIETIPRVGYRFIAPVTEISPARPVIQDEIPSTQIPAAAQRASGTWIRMALGACAAILVLAGGWYLAHRKSTSGPVRSLAVLPLDNLSGDPNQQYFADGMTDELTTMLVRESTLRIISRTSVMQYRGAHKPLPEIARALHVDGIVEGSISRSDSQVHMTLQLIRADPETHLWAQSYDRANTDVAALPDEAARAIALRLNSASLAHATARYVNPEAHDAYLRGVYFWWVGRNEEAGQCFRKAVEIQPDYALGWSGLAEYYGMGALDGYMDPRDALPQEELAARKAVELDDFLPQVHADLAASLFLYRRDAVGALKEITRATEIDPEEWSAWHLHAKILCALGRNDEAIAIQKQSTALNPLAHPGAMAEIYLCTRQYDAAIRDARMRLADFPVAPDILDDLAYSYHWKGRNEEATEMLARELSAEGDPFLAAAVRHAFQTGGYSAVVRCRLAALEKQARSTRVSTFSLAELHGMLSEHDKTLALLEQGVNERDPLLLFLIRPDPAFDFLHTDPRYRDLIHQLGLAPEH
ncbi:MAG TPA: winged helix-turn-helix domain-containing protein [Silvibacterium sp.]|nr:winged helix-turn-helix domain-containing protein [Silvibacterium sp.]